MLGDIEPIGYRTGRKTKSLGQRDAFTKTFKTFPPGASSEFPVVDLVYYSAEQNNTDSLPPPIPSISVVATYEYPGERVDETTNLDIQPYLESEPS